MASQREYATVYERLRNVFKYKRINTDLNNAKNFFKGMYPYGTGEIQMDVLCGFINFIVDIGDATCNIVVDKCSRIIVDGDNYSIYFDSSELGLECNNDCIISINNYKNSSAAVVNYYDAKRHCTLTKENFDDFEYIYLINQVIDVLAEIISQAYQKHVIWGLMKDGKRFEF